MGKYVVLLSSGLDSTINLFTAHLSGEVKLALTFDYGQKARDKEILSAKKICQKLGIPHQVVSLNFFSQFQSSLINKDQNVPVAGQVSIDDLKTSQASAKSVWVPNRNGIFLNIAAGFAENLGCDYVVPGFNKEEAATFPDNSTDFMGVLDQSFAFSTANKVKVKCFTDKLNKTEIVEMGKKMNVDFSDIWPCYFSNEKWCGECESCQRYKRALANANVHLTGSFLK